MIGPCKTTGAVRRGAATAVRYAAHHALLAYACPDCGSWHVRRRPPLVRIVLDTLKAAPPGGIVPRAELLAAAAEHGFGQGRGRSRGTVARHRIRQCLANLETRGVAARTPDGLAVRILDPAALAALTPEQLRDDRDPAAEEPLTTPATQP